MPSRRSHVKSHHGCAQCKARRIKCDETYPHCRKCTKRGIHCSNGATLATSVCSRRSACALNSVQEDAAAATLCRSLSSSPVSEPTVQLVRHYVLHTAQTFCDHPFLLPLWQAAIPRLAVANPYLLHSLAALSSMHLAHLYTASGSPTHVRAALHHQDAALKLIRPRISTINTQNASAIFVGTFLVSLFDIASSSPHGALLFPTSQESTWPLRPARFNHPSNTASDTPGAPSPSTQEASPFLPARNSDIDIIAQLQTIFRLLRGVSSIVEVSADSIRRGPVATLLRDASPLSAVPAAPDVEDALDRLAALCAATDGTRSDGLAGAGLRAGSCADAVANLRLAFRNVGGDAPHGFGAVFKWACTVDRGFRGALRSGDEGALVVVGLYGVLFHRLDGFWWTQGWGRALVAAVEGRVQSAGARELLRWARGKVGRV